MSGKFKRGQIVFQSCTRFAEVAKIGTNDGKRISEVTIGVVIEREIDSCGKKIATFSDRGGNDNVFGRTYYFTNFPVFLFATADEALAALHAGSDVICPDVYTDANKDAFTHLRNGSMRIAPALR
jgi:hypothetical protein